MAKILIVDDSPVNRQFLVKLLGYYGHELFEAADGAQALAAVRDQRPELVVTDVLMPTMDGFEFAHQLQADPEIASTEVIFYTAAYHHEKARALARACGVKHVLVKPSQAGAILAVVKSILRHSSDNVTTPPPPAEDVREAHRALLTDTVAEKQTELERAYADLARSHDALLAGWVRSLDLRSQEADGHTRRVTELCLRLAAAQGIQRPSANAIRLGATLHDIGKAAIPESILLKPGPLTAEEWAVVRRHPVYAYDILRSVPSLRGVTDIPYCHHEKWDGTGYPRGLKGEQIPLAARLFAVANVWDALTHDRADRPAWTEDQARQYIREQAGVQFDPLVVEAFLNLEDPSATGG